MIDSKLIRQYKDRMRIFFIIYFCSEEYLNPSEKYLVKILKTEVKIQKIDFLLRNPDYLAYELLLFAMEGKYDQSEIKEIVKEIFENEEPTIRKLDMERFFFGAYEDIDDVVAFLKGIDFIEFRSERSSDLKVVNKCYYVTQYGNDKLQEEISKFPAFQWYWQRCQLINKYFGHLQGSQLKSLQYEIDEYRNTAYREHIPEIENRVKKVYYDIYKENL